MDPRTLPPGYAFRQIGECIHRGDEILVEGVVAYFWKRILVYGPSSLYIGMLITGTTPPVRYRVPRTQEEQPTPPQNYAFVEEAIQSTFTKYEDPAYVNTKDPYIIRKAGEIVQKGDEVTGNTDIADFDPKEAEGFSINNNCWAHAYGWVGKKVGDTDDKYTIRARYKNPNYKKTPPIPPTSPNNEANVEIYL